MPTEKLYHGATLQLPGHCEWWQVNMDQPSNFSIKTGRRVYKLQFTGSTCRTFIEKIGRNRTF